MLKANGQSSKSGRAGDPTDTETKNLVEKKGYKRAEAAIYLGVAKITIDRLTKRGLLHPSRALRHPLRPPPNGMRSFTVRLIACTAIIAE